MQPAEAPYSDFFVRYLAPAFDEAVTGRDLEIVRLRFGLISGEPLTLNEVGVQFSVSRERIRQIVDRALSRTRYSAKRQIKLLNKQSSSAHLIAHLEQHILPNDEECIERLVGFCEASLSHLPKSTHAIPLIATLIFPKQIAVQLIARARTHAKKLRHARSLEKHTVSRGLIVSERFRKLTNYITWNNANGHAQPIEPTSATRARDVSDEALNSGAFWSEKLQRDVHYESKLERDFYAQLEHVDEVEWYQEQPFGISYDCEGYKRTYYPDALIALKSQRYFVVEIKPYFFMPLKSNRLKWEALNKYCAERGWGVLITDGYRTIQQARNRAVNVQFASEVINRLKSKSLNWSEYRTIAQQHNASTTEFIALILRAELDWSLSPFKLENPLLGTQ